MRTAVEAGFGVEEERAHVAGWIVEARLGAPSAGG